MSKDKDTSRSRRANTRHGMARFIVIINDVSYFLKLTQNDDTAKLYRLTKENQTCYTVGVTNQGYTCNCDDNVRRKPDGGCKHIRALQANGII